MKTTLVVFLVSVASAIMLLSLQGRSRGSVVLTKVRNLRPDDVLSITVTSPANRAYPSIVKAQIVISDRVLKAQIVSELSAARPLQLNHPQGVAWAVLQIQTTDDLLVVWVEVTADKQHGTYYSIWSEGEEGAFASQHSRRSWSRKYSLPLAITGAAAQDLYRNPAAQSARAQCIASSWARSKDCENGPPSGAAR